MRSEEKKPAAPTPPVVNMLESSYSRTFIFASNSSKKINVKEVNVCGIKFQNLKYLFQEKNLIDVFSLGRSELEDFMEEDSQPVSSTDPMLSSPSSLYSSDENLSPQSIEHLIV